MDAVVHSPGGVRPGPHQLPFCHSPCEADPRRFWAGPPGDGGGGGGVVPPNVLAAALAERLAQP
eukprot:8976403-Alexandrium_andersonii.AAC.1